MLRLLGTALRDSARKLTSTGLTSANSLQPNLLSCQARCLSAFARPLQCQESHKICNTSAGTLSNTFQRLLIPVNPTPSILHRTVTKFTLSKGKRKTVKTVLRRFYRLRWGIWIRTRAGRHKRLWKKSAARKRRLKQHVFTNSTQSWMLDKMVTKFWRRPKYYVDDIYEPYHTREEFPISRRKPLPLPEQ